MTGDGQGSGLRLANPTPITHTGRNTMTGARVACLMTLILVASAALAQAAAPQAYVSSPQPLSLGMTLQGGQFTLDVRVTEAATVSVFCPVTPGLMSFSGLTQPVETSYDQKTRMLQLRLPVGQYRLTVRSLP
jgi:hypothetical protein